MNGVDASLSDTIAYNACVGVAHGAAWVALRRWRTPRSLTWGLLGVGGTAVLLTGVWAHTAFGIVRLTGWAIFLHLPLAAGGAAILLRREHRRLAGALFGVAVVVALAGFDAYVLEPRWLRVTHVELSTQKLTRPVRIAVMADIQTDIVGSHERRALSLALAERPDVILFTGDYVEVWEPQRRLAQVAELNRALKEVDLDVPWGSHAIDGNMEDAEWPAIFSGLPVQLSETTRSYDAGELRITAIAGYDSFDPELVVAPSDRYHVAFGHSPDFALGDVAADLLVAGHTHGGQVRLPIIGPLITFSGIPRSWAAGASEIGDGRWLVVSRGIGMERGDAPRLRFLCRPEVVIIDVVPRG